MLILDIYLFIFALLLVIIFGQLLGLVFALFARFLDFCLDYGHVFSKVRLNQAKISAKRQNLLVFTDAAMESINNLPVGEQITQMDAIYWELAKNDKKFLLWICVFCMSARINSFFLLALFVYFAANYWVFFTEHLVFSFIGFFLCSFVSLGTNFFILKATE